MGLAAENVSIEWRWGMYFVGFQVLSNSFGGSWLATERHIKDQKENNKSIILRTIRKTINFSAILVTIADMRVQKRRAAEVIANKVAAMKLYVTGKPEMVKAKATDETLDF